MRAQRLAIEFAVRGARQFGDGNDPGRQHVVGQTHLQMRAQRCFVDVLAITGDEAGMKLNAGDRIGFDQHRILSDVGEVVDDGGNFLRLDAIAAHLDLVIDPAGKFEHAVRIQAHEVAGAVQLRRAFAERIFNETLAGLVGAVQVAIGQAETAGEQFAHHAGRHGLQAFIDHGHPGRADRLADGHQRRIVGQGLDLVSAGEGGRFGWPIAVVQRRLRQRLLRPSYMGNRQGFAAGQNLGQAAQMGWIIIDDGVEQGGGQPGRVGAVGLDGGGQVVAGRQRFGVEHANATVEQRPPDFKRGSIEAERCCLQHRGGVVEPAIGGIADQTQDGLMGNGHALGLAGRARGEHHVGAGGGFDARQGQWCAVGAVGVGRRQAIEGGIVERQGFDALIEARNFIGAANDETGLGLHDHAVQAFIGKARVEREIGGAEPDNAQQLRNGGRATGGGDADDVAGGGATTAQCQRPARCHCVEFAIAQFGGGVVAQAEAQRRRVRGLPTLFGEHAGDVVRALPGPTLWRAGFVKRLHRRRVDQREPVNRRVRVAQQREQRRAGIAQQTPDGVGVVGVGVIVQLEFDRGAVAHTADQPMGGPLGVMAGQALREQQRNARRCGAALLALLRRFAIEQTVQHRQRCLLVHFDGQRQCGVGMGGGGRLSLRVFNAQRNCLLARTARNQCQPGRACNRLQRQTAGAHQALQFFSFDGQWQAQALPAAALV